MSNSKSILVFQLVWIVSLLLIFSSSCKSPLDVDAIRDKDTIYDPNNKPAEIRFIPELLDFDIVFPDDESEMEFSIENISKDDVLVNQISTKSINSSYKLASEFTPFTLGTSSSNKFKSISMKFSNSKTGIFFDTISVNDFKKPTLILKATVPDVYGRDLVFDNTTKGGISGKVLRIFNETDDSVTISQFSIIENQTVFFEEPKIQLPLTIAGKSSVNIVINFNPAEAKNYKSEIRIKVLTNGIVDEIIKLSGTGVN